MSERLFLDLPHALAADAQHGGYFVQRVRALVGNVERAVASRPEVVLPVAAVREVVATLRVNARRSLGRVAAAILNRVPFQPDCLAGSTDLWREGAGERHGRCGTHLPLPGSGR